MAVCQLYALYTCIKIIIVHDVIFCVCLLKPAASSGSAYSIALGNQSTPIVLEYLDCRGNETNLLECPQIPINRRKRQGQMCSTGFEAGVRCAGKAIGIYMYSTNIPVPVMGASVSNFKISQLPQNHLRFC